MADHERLVDLIFQNAKIQFHPDNEHEQDETYLADQLQIGQGAGGKQYVGNTGPEITEQRRPEYDAGDDLADYAGLAYILKYTGKYTDKDQYDDHLKQEHRQGMTHIAGHDIEEDVERRSIG
jgi:hypothetical protein